MKRNAIWSLGFAILGLVVLTVIFAWAPRVSSGPYYPLPSRDQKLPPSDRFIVLLNWKNEAVFDQKTGLVWEKSAKSSYSNWSGAHQRCDNLALGNRKEWRLPTLEELASLVDPSVPSPGPTLPAGHPFNAMSTFYWSATTDARNNANAWGVAFDIAGVGSGGKTTIDYVWCVHDGEGVKLIQL